MTCLFLGGKKKGDPAFDQLKSYEIDQNHQICIRAIVIVPKKIICGVIFPNDTP